MALSDSTYHELQAQQSGKNLRICYELGSIACLLFHLYNAQEVGNMMGHPRFHKEALCSAC